MNLPSMVSYIYGKYGKKNGDIDVLRTDSLSNAIVTIDTEYYVVHEKKAFITGYVDESMVDSATFVIAFKTPVTPRVHLSFSMDSLSGAHIAFYKNSSWDIGTGSDISIYNKFQEETPLQSGIVNGKMILDPENHSPGELILPILYSFGSALKGTPSIESFQKLVLQQDCNHSIVFTSDAANNKGQLTLNWFEHEDLH